MRFGNPSKKTKTIASLKGHSVEFPGKGSVTQDELPKFEEKYKDRESVVDANGVVFVYVPATMHDEVIAAGLLPESEMEEHEAPNAPKKPESAEKLREDVFAAFDTLAELNNREDFAGNGYPKADSLHKLLGYRLTSAEVKDLWPKYMQAKKDE